MLNTADNELLTKTGPGTPMGELFRRFWVPALLSSELPTPDCTPVGFGLLGEQLVAFRDSFGQVGILEARCPHRHANLFWGRNEEGGLRCVYHGWKFAVDGSCLDQPAEPENSRFKYSVRALAYDTHEAGGLIWAYLGPVDRKPPFPLFEWTLVSDSHLLVSKRLQLCNYLQNLEGEVDTAHVNFLHRNLSSPVDDLAPQDILPPRYEDTLLPPPFLARKQFILAESDFGFVSMARSETPEDEFYWRMTPFLVPAFTIIPSPYESANTWTAIIPVDDYQAWGFTATWHFDRPLNEREIVGVTSGAGVHALVDPVSFLPLANKSNSYLIDRELQRSSSFSGIYGIRNEDLAVQEDQDGAICDRSDEHLGVSDRAIVGLRRLLLTLAKGLRDGVEPPHATRPGAARVRSVVVTAPRDVDPVELFLRGQPESFANSSIGNAY